VAADFPFHIILNIKIIIISKRFYHTLGHYPGHQTMFPISDLVALSFRSFPQFGNVAAQFLDYIIIIILIPKKKVIIN